LLGPSSSVETSLRVWYRRLLGSG